TDAKRHFDKGEWAEALALVREQVEAAEPTAELLALGASCLLRIADRDGNGTVLREAGDWLGQLHGHPGELQGVVAPLLRRGAATRPEVLIAIVDSLGKL